ncbi:hypothetical protein Bpfe_027629 [Biomphalaria pfeifferi]|uniref:Uncharacterized protein n=1 Tax=Biomphalaria pfeifferi TaxID=112525 RepID=A0AAD8EWX7_BIOPF|nr:hypothetical protein Bpfe_027629 [Biomphalaria pfeifferi]
MCATLRRSHFDAGSFGARSSDESRHTGQTFPVLGVITKIISVEYRTSILWPRLSELITGSPLLGYTSSARSHLKAARCQGSRFIWSQKKSTITAALKNSAITAALKKNTITTALKNSAITEALKNSAITAALKNNAITAALKNSAITEALKNSAITVALKNSAISTEE